jgi:hypothetical protein
MFLFFILSMTLFLRGVTRQECKYILILLFSPPVTLALERGNVDIFVVSLLVLAVMNLERRRWAPLGLVLVSAAALMKLYPVVALSAAVGRVRRWQLAAALSLILGVFAMQFEHLRFISSHYLQMPGWSWGYSVAFVALRESLRIRGMPALVPRGIEHVFQVTTMILCFIVASVVLRRRWLVSLRTMPHAPGFLAGSSLYCFCWLAGSNFNYRYMVLFLVLPALFVARTTPDLRNWSRSALFCIGVAFWLALFHGTFASIVQEAFTWILFSALFTALLVRTAQIIVQWHAHSWGSLHTATMVFPRE